MGPDSDVYVYPGDALSGTRFRAHIVCCQCRLQAPEPRDLVRPSARSMLAHLAEHVAQGHQVPQRALDRLRAEQAASEVDRSRATAKKRRKRNRRPSP